MPSRNFVDLLMYPKREHVPADVLKIKHGDVISLRQFPDLVLATGK